MNEEFMRQVASQLGAYEYLIGFLLKNAFKDVGEDEVLEVSRILKEKIRNVPDSMTGVFSGNDHLAERFSDIVVKMHEEVDKVVDEAVRAVAQARSRSAQGR